jgi:hypothetical protein
MEYRICGLALDAMVIPGYTYIIYCRRFAD